MGEGGGGGVLWGALHLLLERNGRIGELENCAALKISVLLS